MSKAMQTEALASKFKDALKGAENCIIEIRTPLGNTIGERMQKSLTLAGVKTELVDVVATPNAGVLIEASQKCARMALSLQTAFKVVGIEAHLLIQNSPRQHNLVVIHLSSEERPKAPK